jgi:3-hydroxyacyl-[acyl-carrier-protein] dehydratase
MIDRIISYERGKALRAVKALSLCEDYLADHFPEFPIMPGVLMLESLIQAGGWLLRLSDDVPDALYVLQQARTVRYGSFVKPGDELHVEVSIRKREGDLSTFKGRGTVAGKNAVTGGFTLRPVCIGNAPQETKAALQHFFRLQRPVLTNVSQQTEERDK